MRSEKELLIDCLQRLNRTGLAYMLTGSMASNYWGIPRTTHDLDFVLVRDVRDHRRRDALPDHHRHDHDELVEESEHEDLAAAVLGQDAEQFGNVEVLVHGLLILGQIEGAALAPLGSGWLAKSKAGHGCSSRCASNSRTAAPARSSASRCHSA